MKNLSWQKYLIAFLITAGIFVTAFLISNKLNQAKLETLQATRDKIAIDILSTETQFALLAETSCHEIATPVLSRELSSLGRRLTYAENNLGADDKEVLRLKKYYSLLLIKDFLLGQKIAEKCDNKEPISILYFYSNAGDCPACQKEGYVLDSLRSEHEKLRIYAFDTNLNLSAINTLKSVYDLNNEVPALVINGESYYDFQSREKIRSLLPKLETETASGTATSTATSTIATSSSKDAE